MRSEKEIRQLLSAYEINVDTALQMGGSKYGVSALGKAKLLAWVLGDDDVLLSSMAATVSKIEQRDALRG